MIASEAVKSEGIIRLSRNPFETEEEYIYWWLPVTDGHGRILQPARLSAWDKAQYLELEGYNQITNTGRAQILTYIGSSSGSTVQWAQYFAIGTGVITATSPTDTALANEVFRKAQTSFSVAGTQVDISFSLGISDAQVTMTNGGLYGAGASATLGSGSLETHCLFSYTKGAIALIIDYIVNIL